MTMSSNWDVDEKAILVIGSGDAAPTKDAAARPGDVVQSSDAERPGDAERLGDAVEAPAALQEDVDAKKVGVTADADDSDSIDDIDVPFPLAHKALLVFCLLGVVVIVVYVSNYYLGFF